MDKKLVVINVIYAFTDTLVCLAAIAMFGFSSYHFDKWWIVLFSILPLLFYSNHSVIINADIETAQPANKEERHGS